MGRRVVLLIAAFVIAMVGTGLVFVYAKSADDRALAGQEPVEVLVAAGRISAGTSVADAVSSGAFETRRIPRSAASQGALSNVEPIKDRVALTTLYSGQQVFSEMFGATGEDTATTSLSLPAGKMAVSFQFSDPARVAGFVQPGSKVAVFVTLGATAGAAGAADVTRVLLPQAKVLAAGQTTLTPVAADDTKAAAAEENTESVPKALLTLALDEKETAKLVYASQHGTLYLGLLNDKSKVSAGTVVSGTTLFQ